MLYIRFALFQHAIKGHILNKVQNYVASIRRSPDDPGRYAIFPCRKRAAIEVGGGAGRLSGNSIIFTCLAILYFIYIYVFVKDLFGGHPLYDNISLHKCSIQIK